MQDLVQEEIFLFPTSFAQQRLWLLNQLFPKSPFYNASAGIYLYGNLNLAALEQTFNEIIHRHESLRTTFAMVDGELSQVVAPDLKLPLSFVDLQTIPADLQEVTARQLAIEESHKLFNLEDGPLLRTTLLRMHQTKHVLLFTLHHIICDGWSMGVLIRELSALYTAFNSDKPSPLPDLPIQYADFACWQREQLQGEVIEPHIEYWRQQLKDLPVLSLPTGIASRKNAFQDSPSYRGATLPFELSSDLTEALETLSQKSEVSLFMLLVATFQTLLYRYTGQDDLAVGTPIANRNRSELENLIGFFVNSLVIRTDLSGNPTFRELLDRVRKVTLEAYAHQDLPFEKLVQELHPERDLSRNPLFQVAIALQNTPISTLDLPGLQLKQFEFDNDTTRLDLEIQFWQDSKQLKGQITYSTDLFEPVAIAQISRHIQTLLEAIVKNPNCPIAKLPLLTAIEHQHLMNQWNHENFEHYHLSSQEQKTYSTQSGDFKSHSFLCIHHLFELQAAQTPDAVAIVFKDKQLTYQELNQRSNQLAHHLQQLGVCPDTLVGICIERSLEMIVGILGILKAGGAYVPLDPAYPQAHLEFMLEDTQVSILVTQQKWSTTFINFKLQRIYLDQEQKTTPSDTEANINTQQNQNNLTTTVTAANLAYVIYTSGSTGKPKGVLIEHGGLSNLAHAQRQIFNLQPSDRILQFASLNFDASIFEIVMALQLGATLYLAQPESLLGTELVKLLRDNAITAVTLPPTLLRLLSPKELPALKTIISAGEACSAEIIAKWAGGDRCLFNAYGPTETTVWATVAKIQNRDDKPSLGQAIANTQLYILDSHLQSVPTGIPGELYIAGVGLARGYLNQPKLTAERFLKAEGGRQKAEGRRQKAEAERSPLPSPPPSPSPPSPIPHPSSFLLPPSSSPPRLYRTGDLVCHHFDGTLEFLGRVDNQVKIRGFRIEPIEIETHLYQHPNVIEAAVIVHDNHDNKQLVAYVVPKPEHLLTSSQLRHFLQTKLPNHLIPSTFVVLESLPLTPNGKIDRRSLQNSPLIKHKNVQTLIAPRTPTEKKLAILWMQLLKLEQLGIEDNFFEIGGDSLLAARLIQQVHQQFQQELPLSTLFLAPTIAQLANLLDTDHANPDNSAATPLLWSPLVPLQPAGSNPPFFCIHPIFGVVFPYFELAHQLGTNQPFYGLQPYGLAKEHTPYICIEDMAAHYIKAIKTIQPNGPYHIGGWSFGGLVAFEMAQQLEQQGHQVALLALMDTLAPIPSNKPSLYTALKFLITTVARSIVPFLLSYLSLFKTSNQSTIQSNSKSWRSRFEWAMITNLIPEESRLRMLDELTVLPMLRVFHANSKAAYNYTPKAYTHKINLFKTAQLPGKAEDLTLGWNKLAPQIKVHHIPGNHLTMLRQPHVQTLAQHLKNALSATK